MNHIDRRVFTRRSVQLNAVIILADEARTEIECIIQDHSEGGARLEMAEDVALPPRFHLSIPFLDQVRPVEVRWSRDRQSGVMFLDRVDAV
jgi:hypothetical protein